MSRFDYFRPQSLEEAWQLKKRISAAKFISGGTDLMVQIKKREIQPPALISLRSIPGLNTIEANRSARIGALTTITEIAEHPELQRNYPILVEAAKSLGSVQVRNVATVGGNLCNCSPSADMALPLLVLEAKVRLQTPQGSRDIPLDEFFVGPGESCLTPSEILTDIILDSPPEKAKATFLKKGRVKMDLAIVSAAVLLEMEGKKCHKVRIAVGSVAPVPLRLCQVESLLEGTTVTKKQVTEAQRLAAEDVSPITDIRATEEYRREMVKVFIKRGLNNLLQRSQA